MPKVILGKHAIYDKGFFFVDETGGFSLSDAVLSATFADLDFDGDPFTPFSVQFNNDGTKMFAPTTKISEYPAISEYQLDTAFDLSTAFFETSPDDRFNVETFNPESVSFNGDGTRMFILDGDSDVINKYFLGTSFKVSTANFGNSSVDVSSEASSSEEIRFNGDGSKLFVLDAGSTSVYEYDLSTPYDLGTVSYSGKSFDVGSQDSFPKGLAFIEDGSRMFISGISNNDSNIYEYELTTGFDVSTASFTGNSLGIGLDVEEANGIVFNNDGSRLYIASSAIDEKFFEYTLDPTAGAFDLANASYSGTSFDVGTETSGPTGVSFNEDGSKMFVVGYDSDGVYEYDLSTGFDLSTASYSGTSLDVGSEDGGPREAAFNGDGTKMFLAGYDNDGVYEYDLSTGFDLSTASYSGTSFSISDEGGSPTGVSFNGNGTKMYVVGTNNQNVHEYNLSTGFDLSTASYPGRSFDVSGEDTFPTGVTFNGDGTKMFVAGGNNDNAYEYNLTTGFDLSTASYSGTSFDVEAFDVGGDQESIQGIKFNDDGTRMFMVGYVNNSIYEYTLDLSIN